MEIPRVPATPPGHYGRLEGQTWNESRISNVARGAAWLDENFPGWERRVDLSILDISDPALCICGQVVPQEMIDASKQFTGFGAVTASDSGSSVFGFAGASHDDYWVSLIKERFDTGALSDAF